MKENLPLSLGLTGYPLTHSLSPILHKAALQTCGLEGRYELFPVAPEHPGELDALLARLRSGKLHGLNVTIPHKQQMAARMDELSRSASAIGAVNTIYSDQGRLIGDNTDAPGFLMDLHDHFAVEPGDALVLGAGGAARAVVYALQSCGWQVSIAARREDQSRALQADFPGLVRRSLSAEGLASWKPRGSALIVNATPVGMFPNSQNSPWPQGALFPEQAIIYDLVYNPSETSLLRDARLAGLQGCNGLGMLVAQAVLAFQTWMANLQILPNQQVDEQLRQKLSKAMHHALAANTLRASS
jgi:shikimate dehydrogenase